MWLLLLLVLGGMTPYASMESRLSYSVPTLSLTCRANLIRSRARGMIYSKVNIDNAIYTIRINCHPLIIAGSRVGGTVGI